VDIFPFDIFGPKRAADVQKRDTVRIKQYLKELWRFDIDSVSDLELKQNIDSMMKTKVLTAEIPTDLNDSELVWGLDFSHSWNNWFTDYNVIFPLKNVIFEGLEFPCINDPHAFLSRLYGNYMSYPSKITMGHSMFLNLSDADKKIIKDLIENSN
jgi:hypothetical protein